MFVSRCVTVIISRRHAIQLQVKADGYESVSCSITVKINRYHAIQLQVKADGYESMSCSVSLPSNAASAYLVCDVM